MLWGVGKPEVVVMVFLARRDLVARRPSLHRESRGEMIVNVSGVRSWADSSSYGLFMGGAGVVAGGVASI